MNREGQRQKGINLIRKTIQNENQVSQRRLYFSNLNAQFDEFNLV